MEKRREINVKYNETLFELLKIKTAKGKKGKSIRSTTQTKICIAKTFITPAIEKLKRNHKKGKDTISFG